MLKDTCQHHSWEYNECKLDVLLDIIILMERNSPILLAIPLIYPNCLCHPKLLLWAHSIFAVMFFHRDRRAQEKTLRGNVAL